MATLHSSEYVWAGIVGPLIGKFEPQPVLWGYFCLHVLNEINTWTAGRCVQYTYQEMNPARNARNVVTLAEVMFVTVQRENILPSKITDYWLTKAHELLATEWLKY
jgi:hypothetical protein